MAQAGLIMGVLPTLLAYFGSNTVETGILAMKRPFLALLISAGTPAVWPTRTFDYLSPIEVLRQKKGRKGFPVTSRSVQVFLSVIQYLIAGGAVFNLYYTVYRFTILTVDVGRLETQICPMIYILLSIPIHIAGALSVWWQIRFSKDPSHAVQPDTWTKRILSEFNIYVTHTKSTVREKPERYRFIVLSWAISVGIILHVIWGTIVMAGVLFISAEDTFIVGARMIFSALVCRMVLMSELSGLRDNVTCEDTPILAGQNSATNHGSTFSHSHAPKPPNSSQYALLPIQSVKHQAVISTQPLHSSP